MGDIWQSSQFWPRVQVISRLPIEASPFEHAQLGLFDLPIPRNPTSQNLRHAIALPDHLPPLHNAVP